MKKKKVIIGICLVCALTAIGSGVATRGIVIDPPYPTVMQMLVQVMGK